MFRTPIRSAFALSAALAVASTASATSIVTEWTDVLLDATVAQGPGPTNGARNFAVIHTAMYEAWAAYDARAVGTVTGSTLRGTGGSPTLHNKEEAISVAAYQAAAQLFPAQIALFDDFMDVHGFDAGAETTPAVLGRAAAKAILDFRAGDLSNSSQGYTDTTGYREAAANDAGAWRPLTINGRKQSYVTPHWGHVTPFAMASGSEFRPPAPPAPGTDLYNQRVQEIIDASASLDDYTKALVEYWKMEGPGSITPPGHHNQLAAETSAAKGYGLDDDVKFFFILNNTLLDASIAVWDSKLAYNYIRPVTAVHNLGHVPIQAWAGPGLGTRTVFADEWIPYNGADFNTPPFPEYASGHSAFGAAWAEVTKLYTGSDTFNGHATISHLAVDQRDIAPVTLTWVTYTAAGIEDGYSRIPNGVHFRDAFEASQEMGHAVGELVFEKAQGYFTGAASPSTMYLANLDPRFWATATTASYAAPVFTTAGGLGLVTGSRPDSTFGFWQTGIMDAPAAGSYRTRITFTPTLDAAGQRHPDFRARILRADNTTAAMGIVAQTSPDGNFPDTMNILWESDGQEPIRMALDLLSFGDNQSGGVTVTRIENTRID